MGLTIFEENITDDELIKEDFGSIAVDLKSALVTGKKYEDAINLIEILKTKTTSFYQKEFPYLGDFAVQYYLYTENIEKVKNHLQPFIDNPVQGYDIFITLLNKIRYYKMDDYVVNIANLIFEHVKESDELIGEAEIELVDVIFYNLIQDYYHTIESDSEKSSWVEVEKSLNKMGYDSKFLEVELPKIQKYLKNVKGSNGIHTFNKLEWEEAIKNNSRDAIRELYFQFSAYMLNHGDLHFSISSDIWFAFMDMLSKNASLLDFNFQYTDLDKFLGGYFEILSNKEDEGFAILWGIPYIYDFLSSQQLISSENKLQSLTHVASAKEELLRLHKNDSWRFDFVHKWKKPSSLSIEEFKAEEKKFHQTFTERPEKHSLDPIRYEQASLFDDLFNEPKNKETKPNHSKVKKKKKRKQAKKGRKKNRKK